MRIKTREQRQKNKDMRKDQVLMVGENKVFYPYSIFFGLLIMK
jgi:hypothetical protein